MPARHRRLASSKRGRRPRAQRAAGERSTRGRDPVGEDSGSAGAAPRAPASRRIPIGRVIGAHGLAGELRVRLCGADPASFERAQTLWLARDESVAEAVPHALRAVAVGRAGECRVALAGIRDRTAAEAVRGHWLLAGAQDLARAGPDEYYVYELVGCRVEDRAGNALGAVRGLCGNGAADLLVVEDAEGGEHLVPLVRALLLHVDVEARRIVIDAPPGLFESGA